MPLLLLLHAFASPIQHAFATNTIVCDRKHASEPAQRALLARQAASAFQTTATLTGGACAGCVLLANSAFVQASLLWITLTPVIFKFNRYCKLRFGEACSPLPGPSG